MVGTGESSGQRVSETCGHRRHPADRRRRSHRARRPAPGRCRRRRGSGLADPPVRHRHHHRRRTRGHRGGLRCGGGLPRPSRERSHVAALASGRAPGGCRDGLPLTRYDRGAPHPVVVAVARTHRLDPLPFAFTTVWLANTASLVLPVSNLTNLLAVDRLGIHPLTFARVLGLPALIAVVVTILLLWVVHRRSLQGTYAPAPPPEISDRVQLLVAAVVVVILLPLLVSGVPPWIPAAGAAVVLLAVFVWRSPRTIRLALVPWQLVVFASGLFLAVAALAAAGSGVVLQVVAGSGDDLPSLWQLSGAGCRQPTPSTTFPPIWRSSRSRAPCAARRAPRGGRRRTAHHTLGVPGDTPVARAAPRDGSPCAVASLRPARPHRRTLDSGAVRHPAGLLVHRAAERADVGIAA